jgi:hypothetical protein
VGDSDCLSEAEMVQWMRTEEGEVVGSSISPEKSDLGGAYSIRIFPEFPERLICSWHLNDNTHNYVVR